MRCWHWLRLRDCECRTDRAVNQAIQLIEPVVLVLMAITVGTLAVGLLYPILTMAQSIR
jgi:type II secretory pathway component PulF